MAGDHQIDVTHLLDCIKRSADTHANPVRVGFDEAARQQRVLFLQRIGYLNRRDAQRRQPGRCDFDINLFVLHADQFNFLDIRNTQHLLCHAVVLAS